MVETAKCETVTEAAKRLGCLPGSIHYAITAGRLTCHKLGNLTLVEIAAVNRWNKHRIDTRAKRDKIQQLKRELREKRQ